MLLQANPHKRLRHLYGQRMMSQYRNVGLGELSPHTYAIAEQVQHFVSNTLLLCTSSVFSQNQYLTVAIVSHLAVHGYACQYVMSCSSSR